MMKMELQLLQPHHARKILLLKKTNKVGKKQIGGNAIARKSDELGIKDVVFDRSGYIYHGRVKAVAEGAREGGLKF